MLGWKSQNGIAYKNLSALRVALSGEKETNDHIYIRSGKENSKFYNLHNSFYNDFSFFNGYVILPPGEHDLDIILINNKRTSISKLNLDVPGKVKYINDLNFYLDEKASSIADDQMRDIEKRMIKWGFNQYKNSIGYLIIHSDEELGSCSGSKKDPIELFNNDYLMYIFDHEMAHRYFWGYSSHSVLRYFHKLYVNELNKDIDLENGFSLIMNSELSEFGKLFVESNYINNSTAGHPWSNASELYASSSTVLLNFFDEFLANLSLLNDKSHRKLAINISKYILNHHLKNNYSLLNSNHLSFLEKTILFD